MFLQARNKLYTRANQAISKAIDSIAEVEQVRSIGEFQIALEGSSGAVPAALDVARDFKRVIRYDVGSIHELYALDPRHERCCTFNDKSS